MTPSGPLTIVEWQHGGWIVIDNNSDIVAGPFQAHAEAVEWLRQVEEWETE